MDQSGQTRLGDYELIERLSDEGGQGIVWKARCLSEQNSAVALDEVVALKVLFRTGEYEENEASFQRQTDNFRRIPPHPNIVRYRDSFIARGEWDDHYCLVMDFLEGEDLKTCLLRNSNGLPWERGKRIFQQCLAGLIHAAEAGVVHRDIKPSNIFLTSDGAKIIDFGIARREDSTSTTSAGPKGAFDYMAPDFLSEDGFRGDQLSDVFSLGVCFYEALVGKLPFPSIGEGGFVGYVKRWRDPKKLKYSLPRNPFRVLNDRASGFVKKTLVHERAERFQSFEEMLALLNDIRRRRVEKDGRTYEFMEFLGQGGFGAVFKARRLEDNRIFAVKQLFAKHDPKRFLREARVLSESRNAHIVQFVDFIESSDDSPHYLVMEHLPGMPGFSLRGRIKAAKKEDSRLDVDEVRILFRGYLSALADFHARGIIHRDITPANLYAPGGEPEKARIFDLGIARSDRTETVGRLPGNPEYMAPELIPGALPGWDQSRGDERSDLFSLGLCMFEAVTGDSPYGRRLPKETTGMGREMLDRAEGRIPVQYDHPVLKEHKDIARVIKKATARRPDRRFRTAREMLGAIHRSQLIRLAGESGRYVLGDRLSGDAVVEIYDGVREDSKDCLTIIRIPDVGSDADLSGIQQLKSASHDCLVRYLDVALRAGLNSMDLYIICEETPWLTRDDYDLSNKGKRPFDLAHIVRVFLHILDSLAALHAANIQAGVIEPADLLVPEDATACKLSCWGLHHVFPPILERNPRYTAPELRHGEHPQPDVRSDIYALALCLHKALTGKLPAPSDDDHADVDWQNEHFRACPKVAGVLACALQHDPLLRYGSTNDMAAELTRCLDRADEAAGAAPPITITQPTGRPDEPPTIQDEPPRTQAATDATAALPEGVEPPRPALRLRATPAVKVAASIVIVLGLGVAAVMSSLPLLKHRHALAVVDGVRKEFHPDKHTDFPRYDYMQALHDKLTGLGVRYVENTELSNAVDRVWEYAMLVPEAFQQVFASQCVSRTNTKLARIMVTEWNGLADKSSEMGLGADEHKAISKSLEALTRLINLERRIAAGNANRIGNLLTDLNDVLNAGGLDIRVTVRTRNVAVNRVATLGAKHYTAASEQYRTAQSNAMIQEGDRHANSLTDLMAVVPEEWRSLLPGEWSHLLQLRSEAKTRLANWAARLAESRRAIDAAAKLSRSERPLDWRSAVAGLSSIEDMYRSALSGEWTRAVRSVSDSLLGGTRQAHGKEPVKDWSGRLDMIDGTLNHGANVLDSAAKRDIRHAIAAAREAIERRKHNELLSKTRNAIKATRSLIESGTMSALSRVIGDLAAFRPPGQIEAAFSGELKDLRSLLYKTLIDMATADDIQELELRKRRLAEIKSLAARSDTRDVLRENRHADLTGRLEEELAALAPIRVKLPADLPSDPPVTISVRYPDGEQVALVPNTTRLPPLTTYAVSYEREDYVTQRLKSLRVPAGSGELRLQAPRQWTPSDALLKLMELEGAVAKGDVDGAVRLTQDLQAARLAYAGHLQRHGAALRSLQQLETTAARRHASAARTCWEGTRYAEAALYYDKAAAAFSRIKPGREVHQARCRFNANMCRFMATPSKDGKSVKAAAAKLREYTSNAKLLSSGLSREKKDGLESLLETAVNLAGMTHPKWIEAHRIMVVEDVQKMGGALPLPE